MAKASKNKAKDVESVKLELFLTDRIAIGGIIPHQGGFIEMTLAKDIDTKTKLVQEDFAKNNIRNMPNDKPGLMWDQEKKGKTITFSSAEIELLKNRITELDGQKKITLEMLEVCNLIRNCKKTSE